MKNTYIMKYDLFPHFIVVEGEEIEFNGHTKIFCEGLGLYNPECVLGVFGVEMYEELKKERKMLERKYDEGIFQLRKDLLSSSSVSSIMKHKIPD